MRTGDAAIPAFVALAAPIAEALGTTPYGFLGALAGVTGAVLLLPDKEVRLIASASAVRQAARIGWLVLACFFWALFATWGAQLVVHAFPKTLEGIAEVPFHGACGILIRFLLPLLIRIAKKRTKRLGDDRV